MPTAFNKQTGELRVLDKSGAWIAPTMAANPQTGEKLYLDGEDWKPVPLTGDEEGAGAAASVLQGPLMGFGDEVTAALGNPVSAAKAAFGAENEKTGGYYKDLRQFRDIESRYRAANPGISTALTLAGGAVGGGLQLGRSAFNTAARVLPNAGRLTQAAATGAGFGAAAGYGSGEGSAADRLVSATLGAGLGGATGGALEAAAPALASLYQKVAGNPRAWSARTNRLTPEGERMARAEGIDPAEASAALQQEFAREAQTAMRPGDAAAIARARTLPTPVPLRRGQVTLDPDQQMFESQAGKGVYGQLARETIGASEEAQQQALRGNIPAIAQRIGGGQVQELGQGVGRVQQTLSTSAEASRRGVRDLYTQARAASGAATVEGPQVSQAVFDISQELNQAGFTRRAAGRVHEVIDELQGLATASQQRPSTNIGEIFARRQELSALSQGVPSAETTAAGTAKRGIDRWLTNALDNDLIAGDPTAVQAWRAAIGARRQHAMRFESDDFVSKLVERRPGGGNDLKLDPQAAVNLIFGRSETGFTSQNGMVRGLMRLRSELGPQSQAWNGLREEAFLRFARAGEGASTPTGRDFSGANFARAWEDALAKSPGTMRLLFTDQERNLISQFADVARRTTTNVRGGNNNSNTSAGVAQITRKMFMSAFMGPKMAAFLESVPIVRGLQNIGQDLRAQNAVLGRIQRGTRQQPTPRALRRGVESATGPAASALVQSVFGP